MQDQFSKPFNTNPEIITDAVVTIRRGNGHGSGFIISPEGYILTNAHVVGDLKEIPVLFKGQIELIGKVLKKDKIRDVALIYVPINRAAALPIKIKTPPVSTQVYAIGTPLELAYEKTITSGVISAIRFDQDKATKIIQADVDIQPGNSGGPLVDASGNVIGISTAGIMNSGSSIGINFFIPIATAVEVMNILTQ